MKRWGLALFIWVLGGVSSVALAGAAGSVPRSTVLDRAWLSYQRSYDSVNGGLKPSGDPFRKQSSDLPVRFLLREHRRVNAQQALRMARRSLDAMQEGEIQDPVDGGFYSYATDAAWGVPHLDKNLAINARLIITYLEAYQVTGDDTYARTAEVTLAFLLRDLRSEEGLFLAGQGRNENGNWARDEALVLAWNGLTISALVRASEVLDDATYLKAGVRAAKHLVDRKTMKDGLAVLPALSGPAFQADLAGYAFFQASLIDLFEATAEEMWLAVAMDLQATLDERFWDADQGGYFSTGDDHVEILAREKSVRDGAVASGNSVAAMNLLRLYSLTANEAYRTRAKDLFKAFADQLSKDPTSASEMLLALDFYFDTPKEILIVAPDHREQAQPYVRALQGIFLPNRIVVVVSQTEGEALSERLLVFEGKRALSGKVTAYVCENHTCERPVTTLEDFQNQLGNNPVH